MNKIYVSSNALDRVKKAIVTSNHFKPEKFAEILKSDVYMVLNEYAEIKGDELKVGVELNDFGEYIINICAIGRRLKMIGIVPDKQ